MLTITTLHPYRGEGSRRRGAPRSTPAPLGFPVLDRGVRPTTRDICPMLGPWQAAERSRRRQEPSLVTPRPPVAAPAIRCDAIQRRPRG
jgi:hypothetical protein